MTVLDSRPQAPATAPAAPPAAAPPARDPQARLESLFDPGVAVAAGPGGRPAACSPGPGPSTACWPWRSPATPGSRAARWAARAARRSSPPTTTRSRPGRRSSGCGTRAAPGCARASESLHAVGTVFAAMTRASGRVPQISVVLGPAAGGAAYGPALTDLVILSGQGRIFVTGPDVVRSVTGEDVDSERLGGPEPHSRRSGVVHLVTETDAEAIGQARRLALLLGRQNPPGSGQAVTAGADLAALLPDSARRAYDVRPLVAGLLDEPGIELHPRWAPNVVTTLGRLAGRTVGVIANNPLRLGGCLDATSAEKAARFVRMCDAFGVPLVVRRGRARVPARSGPGMGRGGPARRQAAARVRRGHRAPGDAGDQEGLRRRLHRDELARARRHARVRLAGRRGGRDGRGRGGPDPAPARRWPPRRPTSGTRSRPSSPPSTSARPAGCPARSRSA